MQSSNAPCAACKYLRRKCTKDCVFHPYFPPDNPQKFINVHKVFGASNVSKMLNERKPTERNDTVNALAWVAECRIKDPIYGCFGFVSYLQHNLRQLQQEIERAETKQATYIWPASMQLIPNNPASIMQHQQHNFDPSFYQMAPCQGQCQLLIQEPPQQNQQLVPTAREQEMLMAYEQQLFMQKQQELIAQKQQDLFEQKQMELLGQKFPEWFAQQHQDLFEQQQQMMQRQRIFAEQQQNEMMRFNDAGDGFVQIPADGAAVEKPMLDSGGGLSEAHYQGHEEHAYSRHQQLELFKKQQQMMQRQRMFAEQQQKEMMRSNDAGDGFVQNPADGASAEQPILDLGGGLFETHYQGHEEKAYSHHQQQIKFQDLLLQSPQNLQLTQHQFGAPPQDSQSQRHGNEEEGDLVLCSKPGHGITKITCRVFDSFLAAKV
ncbi:hypothetical protein CASFOL_015236 [Castilleja foliolosa]|uniref:LOB domain-containing protein n=1 Tax=Castilleja foliolosa TaxID=1961234 RepID=A0ABD3DDI3_9LAMI